MLPHYLIYVLVDAKLNEDFCAGALILTFSHICLLISVAEFDAFTVSNMHESMSNTLCFKAQAQIAALSNGCCHKWLINTLSCASLRVDTDRVLRRHCPFLCSCVLTSRKQTVSFFMPLVLSLQVAATTALFLPSVDKYHHLLSCH